MSASTVIAISEKATVTEEYLKDSSGKIVKDSAGSPVPIFKVGGRVWDCCSSLVGKIISIGEPVERVSRNGAEETKYLDMRIIKVEYPGASYRLYTIDGKIKSDLAIRNLHTMQEVTVTISRPSLPNLLAVAKINGLFYTLNTTLHGDLAEGSENGKVRWFTKMSADALGMLNSEQLLLIIETLEGIKDEIEAKGPMAEFDPEMWIPLSSIDPDELNDYQFKNWELMRSELHNIEKLIEGAGWEGGVTKYLVLKIGKKNLLAQMSLAINGAKLALDEEDLKPAEKEEPTMPAKIVAKATVPVLPAELKDLGITTIVTESKVITCSQEGEGGAVEAPIAISQGRKTILASVPPTGNFGATLATALTEKHDETKAIEVAVEAAVDGVTLVDEVNNSPYSDVD